MSALQQLLAAGGLRYKIGSFTVNAAGTYTYAPTISFTGGGGTGAAATANLSYQSGGEAIYSDALVTGAVGLSNEGSGYTSAPTVGFSGGGGSGASGTAVLYELGQPIASVAMGNLGSGYTSDVYYSASSNHALAGGSNTAYATGTMTTRYPLNSYTITNGGTGFSLGSTVYLHINQGDLVLTVNGMGGGLVTSLSGFPTAGLYLVTAATVDTAAFSGGGTGLAVTCNLGAATGVITSWTVTAGGNYFNSGGNAPIWSYVSGGGGGSGATPGVPTLSGTPAAQVRYVNMTAGGSGYIGSASFTFTGGGGSGAAGTVNRQITGYNTTYYGVTSITVNNAGSGYSLAPTVVFSSGSASATANMILE